MTASYRLSDQHFVEQMVSAAGTNGVTPQQVAGASRTALNVLGASYGAKGDGVTDDTVAIQAALTTAGLAGGSVYLPPTANSYLISAPLVAYGSTTIFSDSWRQATIKLKAGSNCSMLVTPDDGVQRYWLNVHDLAFDGNVTNQSGSSDAIAVRAMNEAKIDNVYVKDFAGSAIHFGADTHSLFCTVPVITRCTIRGYGGDNVHGRHGIFLDSGSSDGIVAFNDIGQIRQSLFAGIALSQHNGAQLVGNQCWQCDRGYSFFQTSRTRVVNCLSDYSRIHGFFASGSGTDLQFANCQARFSSDTQYMNGNANAGDGFNVDTCTDVQLIGCRAFGTDARYGVNVNAVAGLRVDGNFFGNTSGTTNVTGASVLVGGGLPPSKAGTPADADYGTRLPPVGFTVVDTSANKLWVRMGANSWKSTALT